MTYPKFDSGWTSSKSWEQKWISGTSRDLYRNVERFRDFVAIDGSRKRGSRRGMQFAVGRQCSLR